MVRGEQKSVSETSCLSNASWASMKMCTSENNFQKHNVLKESGRGAKKWASPFLFMSVVVNEESGRKMINTKMVIINSLFQNLSISPTGSIF
jgi:hypothetical protein